MKDFNQKLANLDEQIVLLARRLAFPFSRFAIFSVYFWFGALKVFSESPANPLVNALLGKTLPGITFESFIVAFGVFEMIVGITFIIPRLERLGVFLLAIHLITTMMPLFLLPTIAWSGFMVPTLEGQYILKNILLVALAFGILSHLRTIKSENIN